MSLRVDMREGGRYPAQFLAFGPIYGHGAMYCTPIEHYLKVGRLFVARMPKWSSISEKWRLSDDHPGHWRFRIIRNPPPGGSAA